MQNPARTASASRDGDGSGNGNVGRDVKERLSQREGAAARSTVAKEVAKFSNYFLVFGASRSLSQRRKDREEKREDSGIDFRTGGIVYTAFHRER